MLRIVCRSPKKSGFNQAASRLTLAVYGNNGSSTQLWNQQQRPFFEKLKARLGINATHSSNIEGLADSKQVINHLKYLSSYHPKDCIEQIHSGWQNGKLPASEDIIKEYLKAAASLKKLDTLDLNGLLALAKKGQPGGGVNGVLTPEAFFAAMNANKRSAGSTVTEPMHVKCE
jgi:hypothetical protein